MMTKRIIAFVASLAVIVGLMNCGSSYAWFVTTLEKKQSISVSVVSTSQAAKLTDINADGQIIIMPGDNLVSLDGQSAMLRINNDSTTDVQIRLCVEYTSYASGRAEQRYYSAYNDDIDVIFAANKWAKKLSPNGICYYYYMGEDYDGQPIIDPNNVPVVDSSVASVDAISSITYKDTISRAYAGQPINVKVKFESKQAKNATWDNFDSYQISGTAA